MSHLLGLPTKAAILAPRENKERMWKIQLETGMMTLISDQFGLYAKQV